MHYRCYDIESLDNLFTLSVFDEGRALEVYYLADAPFDGPDGLDPGKAKDAILAANANLGLDRSQIELLDLSELGNFCRMADEFGLCPEGADSYLVEQVAEKLPANAENGHRIKEDMRPQAHVRPLVRDTDEGFDKDDPDEGYFLLGFNSLNYDMTMLAVLMSTCCRWVSDSRVDKGVRPGMRIEGAPFWNADEGPNPTLYHLTFSPTSAHVMREHNDKLFSTWMDDMRSYLTRDGDDDRYDPDNDRMRWYQSMQHSGRHVDVARVGLDSRHVALKRLLGMLGYQILESSRLDVGSNHLATEADADDLIAYNASDVRNTLNLFRNPNFEGKFEVKSGLLETYPDIVYDVDRYSDDYHVFDGSDGGPRRVRRNRLYRDATSQTLTSRTLCPDGYIPDDLVLSYLYPSRQNAKAENVARKDILDRATSFFERTVASFEPLPGEDPSAVEERRRQAREFVEPVLSFYASLRGLDFNCGEHQNAAWGRIDDVYEKAVTFAQDYADDKRRAKLLAPGNHAKFKSLYEAYFGYMNMIIYMADSYGDAAIDPKALAWARYQASLTTNEYVACVTMPVRWERRVMQNLGSVPRSPSCHLGGSPYFDRYGRWNGTYAAFSVGGIHGAEYDAALYERRCRDWEDWHACKRALRERYADDADGALRLVQDHYRVTLEQHPDLTRVSDRKGLPIPHELGIPDGMEFHLTDFVKSSFSTKRAEWKDEEPERPSLFIADKVRFDTKFDPKYAFTSVCQANHEDFKSYYPNLLDQMSAFENPNIGENRYHDMFLLKEEYGRQMKALPRGSAEAQLISIKRNGVKLQLNTASGAGGAQFDNPVRMNNRILAMRVIGQLFSWQIGQTQASAGAKIPSTNTDGLYTELDEDLNNRLLESASADIGILIEPEVLQLVSKDTNNRVEWTYDDSDPHGYRILSCGGGDLTHWKAPNPTKNLAHPAIADEVLAHYLVRTAMAGGQEAFYDEFDEGRAREILDECLAGDPNRALVMLSMMVVASPSVYKYPFAVPAGTSKLDKGVVRRLEHYTRVYAVRPDAGRDTVNILVAELRKATNKQIPSAWRTRHDDPNDDADASTCTEKELDARRNNWSAIRTARYVINELNGVSIDEMFDAGERYPRVSIAPSIPEDQPMIVENHSVCEMPKDEAERLLADIDKDFYIGFVKDKWDGGWRNVRVSDGRA